MEYEFSKLGLIRIGFWFGIGAGAAWEVWQFVDGLLTAILL